MPHTEHRSRPVSSHRSGRLARLSEDPAARLFVYGSLQFPDVLNALLGRIPTSVPAVADGWRAVELRGVPYPGLISGEGAASGLVFDDLSDVEWYVLDQFEDSVYELTSLTVDRAQPPAWAYTCSASGESVTNHPWDAEAFRARHLNDYVKRCIGWRTRLIERGSTP